MRGGVLLFIEHNLRQASAIAQINKNQVAKVAPPVDPAHQNDVFIRVSGAKIAAVVRSLQCSE
jgi:hypothetical protein